MLEGNFVWGEAHIFADLYLADWGDIVFEYARYSVRDRVSVIGLTWRRLQKDRLAAETLVCGTAVVD